MCAVRWLASARPRCSSGRGRPRPDSLSGQNVFAAGADAYQFDWHFELAFDELDIVPRRFGELVAGGGAFEGLLPAGHRLPDRARVVEVALVCGEVRGLGAVALAVADADRELCEIRQHIEFRESERGDPVHADGIAEGDEVEPAAATDSAGDGAELAAEVAEALLVGAFDLGGERAFADPGDIGLGDAEDAVDARGSDPDTGRGARGDRVRRGDERVGAVVEIEERRLRALEEDVLAGVEGVGDE